MYKKGFVFIYPPKFNRVTYEEVLTQTEYLYARIKFNTELKFTSLKNYSNYALGT